MNKVSILIVEDEAIVAADLAGMLGRLGYEVTGTTGFAEEAISLARERRPDLILMDIRLAGAMDGVEAAGIIHRELDLPVIFLTAHSDHATLERAKLTEPFGYLLKPFEELGLETHIEMALYKHRAERKLRQAHDELELRVEERTRELMEAESELRMINETLEQRIAERTAELQGANTKLLDSRRAALNMMEDAVSSRSQAEETNEELQREVTERKQAEAALLHAKEEWERTFNSVPDLIAIIDDTHRVVRVNKAMADRIGREPEKCVGMPCYEAVHGANLPPDFCPHSQTFGDGGAHNVEFHEERLGGDFLVTTTPLLDSQGRMTGTVHVARDITERKQAEEALRRAHNELEKRVGERTQELADTVEILLEQISERERAEASIQRLNRLYAVLGGTAQAIIRAKDRDTLFHEFCSIAVEQGGFLLAWVGLVDDESELVRIMASCGATSYLDGIHISVRDDEPVIGPTGISIREGSYYICNDFLNDPCTQPWHDRGRTYGIQASASVAVKEDGRVVGTLALYAKDKDFFDRQQMELIVQMGADISFALDNFVRETRRHEAERALLEESAERLRVAEELRGKERMLIQQSRHAAMGEMIGNIAHQWRQPLNALGLTIQRQLLFYDLGEFSRESLAKDVSSSMELIQHMSKTIDDFSNYFKPDKNMVEFKVREALENALSLLEGSLQNPRIRVNIAAKDDPVIFGYQNEFAQVLLNILINARDALIEREIGDPRVTVTIFSEDGCAVLTIADNAGGISREIIGKIFDPYFTTKGPQHGTGVGLFMSKAIVEKNMGGKLSVRNSGNGAEFRIEVSNEVHI